MPSKGYLQIAHPFTPHLDKASITSLTIDILHLVLIEETVLESHVTVS